MKRLTLLLAAAALLLAACDKGNAQKPDETEAEQQMANTEAESAEAADEASQETTEAEKRAAEKMGSSVEVVVLQHGSFMLMWKQVTIAIDPVTPALEAHEGDEPKADLILLTDIHPDHLDPAAVAKVSKDSTVIIAPQSVVDQAGDKLENTLVMANGESQSLMDDAISIEATPMYNTKRMRPDTGKPFHVKGRGNGYLLSMGDKRVYISGDTECIPEMKAMKDIDMAFVTMNLPYTMPVEEAAECIAAFEPAVVYPFHFRGKDGMQDVSKLSEMLAESSTEVRVLDWYPSAE